MTAEEQRQIDAEARRAALRSMESMGDIGSRTGAAVAPALPPSGFDENGIGPIDMQPAAEPATPAPVEVPNRDHLGNIDPSSGSVFGPDFPETEEAAPDPAPTVQRDPAVRDRVMGSSASQPIPGASALADPRPSIVRDRLGPKPPVDAAREAAAGPLPTLDAGLPSEADIAGAREGAGDSFLRHLQNGLRGAIGMPTREAPTTADDLASERRAGIRAGMERKGVLRSAESTAAATADRQSRQDALAERGLDIRQQQADAATRAADQRGGLVEAQTAHVQAQTESEQLTTQFSRATREERQSAESQLSRGYQQAINATLRGMGAMGDRFRGELTSPIEEQSAEQLEPLLRRVQSLGLRAGAGGGGSGASRATLEAAAREHHATEAEIAAASDADLRALNRTATARPDAPADDARPVVWSRVSDGGEPITADARTFATPTARTVYQGGLTEAATVDARLSEIERVYDDAMAGATGPLARARAWGEIQLNGAIDEPINMLLGSITHMAETGVINPGPEADRLRSMVPDPSSMGQMTFGQFETRMAQFRRGLREEISAAAAQHGVSEADTSRLLRQMHLGGSSRSATRPATPATPTGAADPAFQPVTLTLPDGRTATARTQSALDAALAAGATR